MAIAADIGVLVPDDKDKKSAWCTTSWKYGMLQLSCLLSSKAWSLAGVCLAKAENQLRENMAPLVEQVQGLHGFLQKARKGVVPYLYGTIKMK